MIRIAVCDDSLADIDEIKDIIDQYSQIHHIGFYVSAYEKSSVLAYELTEGTLFDIYILDVSMPDLDGFEIAEKIRTHTYESVIIFLTSMNHLAAKGYKYKALRYIDKLNLQRDFEEAMDDAIKQLGQINDICITLHSHSDYTRVPFNQIVSVSRTSRQLVINTKDMGQYYDSRGINELFGELDGRFVFIDRSCFVNIDHVTEITAGSLKMSTGQELPISRRQIKDVKQKIIVHWGL